VFCCVGNDDDLRDVVLGKLGADGKRVDDCAGMKPGTIFVDHTTASANVARELSAAAKNIVAFSFIDAPGVRRTSRCTKRHVHGDVRWGAQLSLNL
jgi:3-hydroxyisobutyrate dehydrogenase